MAIIVIGGRGGEEETRRGIIVKQQGKCAAPAAWGLTVPISNASTTATAKALSSSLVPAVPLALLSHGLQALDELIWQESAQPAPDMPNMRTTKCHIGPDRSEKIGLSSAPTATA